MRHDDARQRVHGRLSRKAKPRLDGLEDRLLLYATTGGAWLQPARVTFSFVPDGTSIGGPTSTLYASLNAQHPGWQAVFQQAAAVWEQVANVNLVLVGDNGVAMGVGSDEQGDPNNGDIRISAIPQGTGALAYTFLPPPLNGYPEAGDIVFNSSQNWTTNTDNDLLTVAIHEFGHALGLGHSAITTADMYAFYNGSKTYLTSDDISGMQAIYGPRQPDAWTAAYGNTAKTSAADITSQIATNGQAILTNLDITNYNTGNWFKVTVPASTTGSMTVVMQSTRLSELGPRVQVYDAAGTSLIFTSAPSAYGATIGVTLNGIAAGQVYYIKTSSAGSSANSGGNYALEVNFGSGTLPTVNPPYTTVANQTSKGGGTSTETVPSVALGAIPVQWLTLGLGNSLRHGPTPVFGNAIDYGNGLISIGSVLGWGDAMTVQPGLSHAKPHPSGPRRAAVHHAHVKHA